MLRPRLAKLNKFISTFFYVGFLRPAPGTWGSIAGIISAYTLLITMGFLTFLLILLFTIIIGFWSTKNYIKKSSKKSDPSEVVIDEVIGQWITVLPIGYILEIDEFLRDGLWFVWLWAFFSFRFFDIIKLGLIGWADNLDGAMGVLLDDILAGVAAGLTVVVLIILLFTTIIGFWSTKNYIKKSFDNSDPSEVVIDEVIGQWITILPIGYILEIDDFLRDGLWFAWLWALVSFRFFDIFKLGLIGWADNLDGAIGILLDDILAGVAAGLTVVVLIILK